VRKTLLLTAALAMCLGTTSFIGRSDDLSTKRITDAYVVKYNPYANVNWGTVNKLKSQTHDHIDGYGDTFATGYDDAGYEVMAWSHYSGCYQTTGASTCTGWCGARRWPAETNGLTNAPAISGMSNLVLYTPGAEECGLLDDATLPNPGPYQIRHLFSLFLTDYLEGEGCAACGTGANAGLPVAQNPYGIPAADIYHTEGELITMIKARGGFAVLNHFSRNFTEASTTHAGINGIEVYNNLLALKDDFNVNTVFTDSFIANWDKFLANNPRIWGFAVNDHFGPSTTIAGASSPYAAVTTATRDRGYLTVLSTDTDDLDAYETAIRAGAFFAVVDGVFPKDGGPDITDISVADGTITITTAAADETITWYANGTTTVGTGVTLDLSALGADTYSYVRAEVVDAESRRVFVQPFTIKLPGNGRLVP